MFEFLSKIDFKSKKFIIISAFAFVLLLGIVYVIFPFFTGKKIADGIFIDDINLSGYTKEQAQSILDDYKVTFIHSNTITAKSQTSATEITFYEYGATLDFSEVLDTACSAGKEGNLIKRILYKRRIKKEPLYLFSTIIYDNVQIDEIILNLAEEHNISPISANIKFDPSEFNFFDENADTSSIFKISQDTFGKSLDKKGAKEQIIAALLKKESSTIILPMNDIVPDTTTKMLKDSTQLIFHSSSFLPLTSRLNSTKINNIQLILNSIKGLVVMPGDTISFFELVGEPTSESGWETPPVTSRDRNIIYDFQEISQAATAIYNAVFRTGAQIIEINHHTYPAYSKDYGYGMDAYVKYGENDLVFKNTSDYPIFFDAYCWYDASGRPGYVDVDVYTFPIGKNMYIAPISEIVETIPPPPTEYLEVPQESYSYYNWTFDEDLDMYTFQQTAPRDGYIVQTYKAIYENGVQESPGVWTGGELISKEEYERIEYPAQQGLILTKPANIE